MRGRKPFWLTLGFLGIAVVLAAFNYWSIVGWLRQESFYDGRPTSYWEAELEQWCCVQLVHGTVHHGWGDPDPPRSQSWPVWFVRVDPFERLKVQIGISPSHELGA